MNPHSLRVLEFAKIREALAERATWAGGVRRAEAWAPLAGLEASERREGVAEVRRLLESSDLPIHGLPDLETVLALAETEGAILSAAQIAPVAKSLSIVGSVSRHLHERHEELPRLAGLARGLHGLGELRGEIERMIDPSGEVRDGATSALRRIRRDQERVRARILSALQRVVRGIDSPGSDPVITIRNERHVIGVRRDRTGDLRGVIHGRSGSGASVYLEPGSVVPLNNELAELRSAEDEEIRRILEELTGAIRVNLEPLRVNEDLLAELDALYAGGKLSRDLDARPAETSDDGKLVIRRGRHPVLEMSNRASGGVTVPLDLELGGESARTLVITGPNTGGKTVALKTVGLFALMHQAGLHVPAAEGTLLPALEDVFADIGDEQSIEASLSTFSSHMKHVVEMLSGASPRTLVLLDELGVGTDPDEGAALGRAVLSELTRVGSLTIATTHYGALKVFAHSSPGMVNGSLEFDRESLAPTYRFLQGVPGSSEALSIARRLGFPSKLIDLARESVGRDKEAVESLLQDLQARSRELREAQVALAAERSAVAELEEKVRSKLGGVAEERAKRKREALAEASSLVEKARAEVAELVAAARGDAGGKAGARARTGIGELARRLERERFAEESRAGSPARPARPEEIEEGTPVAIPEMGWKGTALAAPGSNGKVPVSVGSLRVEVAVSSLELRGEPAARPAPESRRPALVDRPDPDAKIEIDLRGQTVEEALASVDRSIDDLVIAGGNFLRIIHGKGTGALRVAIGARLGEDARVESFRLGEPPEGGSGVTIVVLS